MLDAYLNGLMQGLPLIALLGIIVVSIAILAKGADLLVDQAVVLSARWGVPKMLIGATVVSLGTTLPETAVSVVAALAGTPGLALGNAVGSIICDTGLILGIATLVAPLTLNPRVVNRQGWIQLGSAVMLVAVSIPFVDPSTLLTKGGRIPQFVGWIFLMILLAYIILSIRWARKGISAVEEPESADAQQQKSAVAAVLLVLGILLVVGGSEILIPAVREAALRMRIPESVIGATLVAFGTSLPELVTAVTSARKGHGDLAVGNIIGADILNVLFVVGSAASVTAGGLAVHPNFYYLLFPIMLLVLIVFRIGIAASRDTMKRPFGAVLLGLYLVVTIVSYLHNSAVGL